MLPLSSLSLPRCRCLPPLQLRIAVPVIVLSLAIAVAFALALTLVAALALALTLTPALVVWGRRCCFCSRRASFAEHFAVVGARVQILDGNATGQLANW